MLSAGSTPAIRGLTVEQAEAVVRLSCLPAFKDLIAKVQADEVGVPDESVPRKWAVRECVCRGKPRNMFVRSSNVWKARPAPRPPRWWPR